MKTTLKTVLALAIAMTAFAACGGGHKDGEHAADSTAAPAEATAAPTETPAADTTKHDTTAAAPAEAPKEEAHH